jgi:hypothetical protein
LRYLGGAIGYIALPVLLAVAACGPSPAAIRDVLWPAEPSRRFAVTAFWTPLVLPPLLTMATGLGLNPIWSMAGLTLLPVMLLSSPLVSCSRNVVRSIIALAAVLPFLVVVAAPAIAVVTHTTGLISPTAAHGRLLAERVEQEWRKSTDRPLRLVGGDLDLANVVAFYLPERPSTFPVSEPQLAPWVTQARIARDGIAIVCHGAGIYCLHRWVNWQAHLLLMKFSSLPGHRTEFELKRSFLHWPGEPAPYLIFIIPPA